MSKNRFIDEATPLVGILAGALLIELGAQLTGWPDAVTAGLVGVVGTLVVLVGAPFAMGYVPAFRRRQGPAVVAVTRINTAQRTFHLEMPERPTTFVLSIENPERVSYVGLIAKANGPRYDLGLLEQGDDRPTAIMLDAATRLSPIQELVPHPLHLDRLTLPPGPAQS